MKHYIECKVRYEKMMDDGMRKKVTETYIVEAMSCTEAEARAHSNLAPYIDVDFDVDAVKKSNFSEIIFDERGTADKFFKVRAVFITINERTSKEKKSAYNYLVQAGSVNSAVKNFDKLMGGTIIDYAIVSVSETQIIDVYEAKIQEDDKE